MRPAMGYVGGWGNVEPFAANLAPPVTAAVFNLLLESGDVVLLESGDNLLKEAA